MSWDENMNMTDAKNVDLRDDMIKPVEPKRNAIIIDFEASGKKIITIECLNDELYEDMKKQALLIGKDLHSTL